MLRSLKQLHIQERYKYTISIGNLNLLKEADNIVWYKHETLYQQL
ncbi:hypothetical protein SALWKB2_1849 [Snodgrassella alvi wkB2]|nr:hypothetical protein SALWKB2_1849 [Snodgrassella alvi wkB2]